MESVVTFMYQDVLVEALKSTTLPTPQIAKHVQGGRPLSEPMLTPHSPQTNNGYAIVYFRERLLSNYRRAAMLEILLAGSSQHDIHWKYKTKSMVPSYLVFIFMFVASFAFLRASVFSVRFFYGSEMKRWRTAHVWFEMFLEVFMSCVSVLHASNRNYHTLPDQ